MNIFFVSLGCDKNLVDSEEMLGALTSDGYRITDDESKADVIIVNTCCFIHDAKEESIQTILEIEVQGALNVKAKNPEALLLFVTPPSAQELKRRLIGRGTETLEVINERMARASEEALLMDRYDYLIINDKLEERT